MDDCAGWRRILDSAIVGPMCKVCGVSVIAAREIAANTTLPKGDERQGFGFRAGAMKNQLDLGSGQILGDNVGRISTQATSWLTDGHKERPSWRRKASGKSRRARTASMPSSAAISNTSR